jgi:hypothetical protein
MLSDPWLNCELQQVNNHTYSSPEQLEAAANVTIQKVDWFTSDLFSLGIVILEAYHLDFMDEIYTKNARGINNQQLNFRITAIRTPTLKRYVDHLLGSPHSRLAISE